mmetsp:Transcript_41269/g.81411  ORF Transcript_41269/g.81411 Transcript_41269/m.81411 type:complete len:137 (+) Transcript_41269:637-1047(+)
MRATWRRTRVDLCVTNVFIDRVLGEDMQRVHVRGGVNKERQKGRLDRESVERERETEREKLGAFPTGCCVRVHGHACISSGLSATSGRACKRRMRGDGEKREREGTLYAWPVLSQEGKPCLPCEQERFITISHERE